MLYGHRVLVTCNDGVYKEPVFAQSIIIQLAAAMEGASAKRQRTENEDGGAGNVKKFKATISKQWYLGSCAFTVSFDKNQPRAVVSKDRKRIGFNVAEFDKFRREFSNLLDAVKTAKSLTIEDDKLSYVVEDETLKILRDHGKITTVELNKENMINLNKYIKYIVQHFENLQTEQKLFEVMTDSIVSHMKLLNFNDFDAVYQYIGTWGLYSQITKTFAESMASNGMTSSFNANTIYMICMSNLKLLRARYT